MSKELKKLTRKLSPNLEEVLKTNLIFSILSKVGGDYKTYQENVKLFKQFYAKVREEFGSLALMRATEQISSHTFDHPEPEFEIINDIIDGHTILRIKIKDSHYNFSVQINTTQQSEVQAKIAASLIDLLCCSINLYVLDLKDFGTELMGTSNVKSLLIALKMEEDELASTMNNLIKSTPEEVNKYIKGGYEIKYTIRGRYNEEE